MRVKIVYVCENCERENDFWSPPFNCQFCGREICETCMHGLATCADCAKVHTQQEMQGRFEANL